MPFKANADRRHRIPKQRRRITNWAEYDAALRQRGSLTVWFTEAAIAAWHAEPRTTPGGQPHYSDLAITTALTLKAVFRLALRQTEGLIGSVIRLLGLDLSVPDHTTLSRRAETLEVPRPRPGSDAEPVHLLVDSTGLKLCGPGEWLIEKHGTRRRRAWSKLHIGMDADTGRIVASELTPHDVDDGAQVGPLLDQVAGPLASFTGDGAYDRTGSIARHRTPSRCSGDRPAALDGRAKRGGRDGADAARPTPAAHCRARPHGLAEGLRLQPPCPGRGNDRPLQTGDRRRVALAHGAASGHRDERRRRGPEPHAGAGTPGVRPHRMSPERGRVIASAP